MHPQERRDPDSGAGTGANGTSDRATEMSMCPAGAPRARRHRRLYRYRKFFQFRVGGSEFLSHSSFS